jgi:hypothetical protein
MDAIEAAILRTVLYADVFQFPLTTREIHHFLIHDQPVPFARIEQTLAASLALKQVLYQGQGYFVRKGRDDLIAVRAAHDHASTQLLPLSQRYGIWLARLPFVRMVALTGALAMRNAVENDDLDYLLVTTTGRVWLARAFSIVLVRLVRFRGTEICPNYVLAEDALTQKRRDVFIAHEVTQMVPLYGHELYHTMRAANDWVGEYLPNANGAFYDVPKQPLGNVWASLKRAVEVALGGRLGDLLEQWEYRRKLRRFAPKMQRPNSAAQIDASHVKGHFEDHGSRALREYHARLREFGLTVDTIPHLQAGD